MTGTMELSDQDVQDLVDAVDSLRKRFLIQDGLRARLNDLKERLLKVEVNST